MSRTGPERDVGTPRFGPENEGQRVVTPRGEIVGRVERVRDGDAYIAPPPGLLDGIGSWVAGPWSARGPFRLDRARVAAVEEDEIVLKPATTDPPRFGDTV